MLLTLVKVNVLVTWIVVVITVAESPVPLVKTTVSVETSVLI